LEKHLAEYRREQERLAIIKGKEAAALQKKQAAAAKAEEELAASVTGPVL
jgi:hypothetical protein